MIGGRIALALAIATALLLSPACREGKGDGDEARAPASAPVAHAAGVTLTPEALSRSAVRVATLQPATHAPMREAFGQVLDTTPLFQAATAAAARRAELETARASLAASEAELARVRMLHDTDENASQRSLEAAQAAAGIDKARAAAAQAQVAAGWSEIAQSWGAVITRWLEAGSPELKEVASGRSRLLLLTLAMDAATASAPPDATIEHGGRTYRARLVSPAPRTDPTLQAPSFFYRVADAGDALATGMNVAVRVPTAEPRPGVLVPEAAVVRWSGVAWVYRQRGAGHFERVALGSAEPVDGGLFVTSGLAPGEEIAVAGAAVLLSQELIDLGLAPPGGEE